MFQLREQGAWSRDGDSGWMLAALEDLNKVPLWSSDRRHETRSEAREMEQVEVGGPTWVPRPFFWGRESCCPGGGGKGRQGGS